MPLATSVMHYLQRNGVPWQQVLHDRVGNLPAALEVTGLQRDAVVVAELFIDAKGVLMAVLPYGQQANVALLNEQLKRRLQKLTNKQAAAVFRDCEPGSCPPVASAYGIMAVGEAELLKRDVVYMQSGCHTTLIKLEKEAFHRLLASVRLVNGCACAAAGDATVGDQAGVSADMACGGEKQITARLKAIYRLPPMPAIAAKIMRLTSDPRSSIDSLVAVIDQDPSLAAQMIREARSPLYGFRGQIHSVREAVIRVLGYERVSQMAMAIAALKAFDVPVEGRLGLPQIWRHALLGAVLAQKLALHMPAGLVDPALVYLGALLHNFGLLLLGHLFRPEYLLLSRRAEQEPETSLVQLEKQALGMGGAKELVGLGHGRLGAILLEHWNLPPEVVTVARHHQHVEYAGPHQETVWLVQLANALLKDLALGDDLEPEDPLHHARLLAIDPAVVFEIYEQLKLASTTIDPAVGSH